MDAVVSRLYLVCASILRFLCVEIFEAMLICVSLYVLAAAIHDGLAAF